MVRKKNSERHPAAQSRKMNPHFGRGGAHDPGKGGPYRRAKKSEEFRRAMRDAERGE